MHGADCLIHIFSLSVAVFTKSSEGQDSLLVHQTRSIDQRGVVLTAAKRGLVDRDDSLCGNAMQLIDLHGVGLLHLSLLPTSMEPRLLFDWDARDVSR